MATKLLIRPQPFPEESIHSWLARITESNAFRNRWRILVLARAIGLSRRASGAPLFDDDQLGRISRLLGCSPEYIKGLVWDELRGSDSDKIFSRQFLFTRHGKICPMCLGEKGYWAKNWQLLPVTCCIDHGLRLVSSCKCGASIDTYPFSVNKCACGRRLSKLRRIDATSYEIKIVSFLDSAMSAESSCLLLNRLYELQFCLWYWYQSVRNHDELLIQSWNQRRVVSGCKYVGTLIENDIINIEPLMRRYVESQGRREVRFRSILGDCHDYVKRMVESGYTGDFYNQLTVFEEGGWHGSKLLRRSRYGESSLLKTIKETARDYESKPTNIERVVEYENLDVVQKNQRIRLVDASDDGLLTESVGSWLSLDQAAKLTGISKNWVQQLVEAKLLDGRKRLHQRDWLIQKKSCYSLNEKLKMGASSDDIRCVPLRTLQLFPEQAFSKVIYKCLEGSIVYKFHSNVGPLGNLVIERQYLQALESLEKRELRSAKETSEFLNINLNALYYLIKKRYITSSSRCCRNRNVYGFSDVDIDNFRDRYCFHIAAKEFLLSSGREDLIPSLKAVNSRCTHRSRIRIYKWQYIKTLVSRLKQHSKPSLLYGLNAAAQYVGVTVNKLRLLTRDEWILPYTHPGHHSKSLPGIQFTVADLNRLKALLENYPEMMPLRAASRQLGYDRSHVRKQFVLSGYLRSTSVPECPGEILCFKKEVFALKRIIARTVTGPQLASLLGVTRNTVYKWMRAGKLVPIISPTDEGFGNYRYSIPNKGR